MEFEVYTQTEADSLKQRSEFSEITQRASSKQHSGTSESEPCLKKPCQQRISEQENAQRISCPSECARNGTIFPDTDVVNPESQAENKVGQEMRRLISVL